MHFVSLRRILNTVFIVFYEGSLSRFELPPQTREQCMVPYLGKLFARLIAYKRHMISIYRNKTVSLNKRSRRGRNINMAQHETTKMPVCLSKRLLSQAIFNNAIHLFLFLFLCIPTYNFALKSFARFTFQ